MVSIRESIFYEYGRRKVEMFNPLFPESKPRRTKDFYLLMPTITQKVLTEQLKQIWKEMSLSEEKYLKKCHLR